MINRIKNINTLEVTYSNNDQLVAYTRCTVHHSTNQLQITDLFAVRDYKDMNFEDMLLEEIFSYAQEQGILTIVVFVGPEPSNPDPYWTVDDYIAWYESYGFVQSQGNLSYGHRMVYQASPLI